MKSVYNRNWRETENHYRQAIELNPNYAIAYGWYGMILSMQKRFDGAELQLRKAGQLDPTSRSIAIYLAWKFYFARQFDEAIKQSRKALELDNSLTTPYMILSAAFEQKGMFNEAVEAELRRETRDSQTIESLKDAYRKFGIKDYRQKQIEVFQKKNRLQRRSRRLSHCHPLRFAQPKRRGFAANRKKKVLPVAVQCGIR